jgi:hypothetical protein
MDIKILYTQEYSNNLKFTIDWTLFYYHDEHCCRSISLFIAWEYINIWSMCLYEENNPEPPKFMQYVYDEMDRLSDIQQTANYPYVIPSETFDHKTPQDSSSITPGIFQ